MLILDKIIYACYDIRLDGDFSRYCALSALLSTVPVFYPESVCLWQFWFGAPFLFLFFEYRKGEDVTTWCIFMRCTLLSSPLPMFIYVAIGRGLTTGCTCLGERCPSGESFKTNCHGPFTTMLSPFPICLSNLIWETDRETAS